MPSEWKFVVHSWIFEVYSKNVWLHSECIPKYSGPFLWPARMYSRCTRSGQKYRMAFELHSDCILRYSYGPLRTAFQLTFETFWSPSIRRIETASHFKSCQNVPNAPRMSRNVPRMRFDCCRNLFRYYKKFSWNAIQMSEESFDCRCECGSNSVRTSRLALEWVRT